MGVAWISVDPNSSDYKQNKNELMKDFGRFEKWVQ